MSNADLVFSRKPSHLLNISEIERILTYKFFKDNFLRLRLDTLREVRKFL